MLDYNGYSKYSINYDCVTEIANESYSRAGLGVLTWSCETRSHFGLREFRAQLDRKSRMRQKCAGLRHQSKRSALPPTRPRSNVAYKSKPGADL